MGLCPDKGRRRALDNLMFVHPRTDQISLQVVVRATEAMANVRLQALSDKLLSIAIEVGNSAG